VGEQGDPAHALGVHSAALDALNSEILADFVLEPPYGIGWWAPNPGTSRRILISHQLYACVQSVGTNLTEAAIHWLEFQDYSERESDFLADAVRIRGGEVEVRARARVSPWEDILLEMVDLHLVGTVRALAGALDCLAGVVVVVVALETSMLKADFGSVRKTLREIRESDDMGQLAQREFGTTLEGLIERAGPRDWLQWLLFCRNMLVHRGRRLAMSQFLPREPVLLGPDGRPRLRTRIVRQLPRAPEISHVESFRHPDIDPVLTEGADVTLGGLLASTRSLIDTTSARLLEFWRWRKDNPAILAQPVRQWRDGVAAASEAFRGYAPGSVQYNPAMLMSHPVIGRRLRAAALDDAVRHEWEAFD
jgi:hypothetical protein